MAVKVADSATASGSLSMVRSFSQAAIESFDGWVSRYVSFNLDFGDKKNSTLMGIGLGAVVGVASLSMLKSMIKMKIRRSQIRDAKTGRHPAGPTPRLLWGNVLDLRASYYETLHEYVDAPASVFWVHATPFVVVNDEDGLRRVLGGGGGVYSKPKYFGYRSRTVSTAVDNQRDGVAQESIEYDVNGDTSRVALEIMIQDAFPKICKYVQHMTACLTEQTTETEDSVHVVRQAIVSLNLNVLFGAHCKIDNFENTSTEKKLLSTDFDARRISNMIDFAGTEFARRMVNPTRVWYDIWGNIRFIRDVAALIQLGRQLSKILDMSVKPQVTDDDASDKGVASGVSWVHAWVGKVGRIGKLGKVVGLLMASTQTVPLTAVWLLHLLAEHKDVLDRLVEELTEHNIRSIDDLSYDKLEHLVYLDAVVKETLRLFPPFPLIQRQAQQDNVLAGVTIKKDMIVYVVPWLVHRNPRFFNQPHQFNPQRFVDHHAAHGDAPSDWAFLPFGRGPRMCAGSKLALAELKVLAIHSALQYNLSSRCVSPRPDDRFPELGMIPLGVRIKLANKKSL